MRERSRRAVQAETPPVVSPPKEGEATGVLGWIDEAAGQGPGNFRPAAWRAVWTAIFVFLAGALQQLIADPEIMSRLMLGEAGPEITRLVVITVLAGGFAAIKRYYDIKIPA